MKNALPTNGLIFRFAVSGATALLVIFIMSLALASAQIGESATGEMLISDGAAAYVFIEIMVGLITFTGSFHVVSRG